MKKILLAGMAFCTVAAQAQKTATKPKTAAPVAKPAAVKPLKNQKDSVSYAIGTMVASFYKQQGLKDLNSAMVAKAVQDVYANKKTLLTETECNTTVMRALQPDLSKTIAEGEAFLVQNGKRPEVKTTASGLQYEVIRAAEGRRPVATDTVTVHYRGTLIDGKDFDNSYQRGQPISFPLGNVIAGWTEGLQYMPIGSKYKLYIPSNLGYGMNGAGQIPGGATLVFEVELLKINGQDK